MPSLRLLALTLGFTFAVVTAGRACAFEPSMILTTDKSSRPIIFGTTNLPDGTQLMVSITKDHGGYAAGSKTTVTAGHFATEQFSNAGQPLVSGLYKMDVQMVLPGLQPDAVRAAVGDHGQMMSGALVVKVMSDFTVSYHATFQLGTAVAEAVPESLPPPASRRPGYETVTVRNFVIDGPQLTAENARVTITGTYILMGSVATLYADTQAVLMAKYYPDAGTQPSVPLLTTEASHQIREVLVACDSNPSTGQLGCQVTIRGQATICALNNAFGAIRDTPCVNVNDGERWAPQTPRQLEQAPQLPKVELPRQPQVTQNAPASSPVSATTTAPDNEIAPVKAINPDAAEKIQSYCSKVPAGDVHRNSTISSCEQREVDAWNRVVLKREFREIDPAIDRKCSEPPLSPDSFVAYEACMKYELNNR